MKILKQLPSPGDYLALVSETGWDLPTHDIATAALRASLCGAIAIDGDKTVGMVRAVGDGVMKVYIQDMIVAETHRNGGIGRRLMQAILSNLSEACPKSCMIGLFAADGQSEFYSKLGFISRPGIGYGPGMHATLSELAKPRNAA